MSDAKDELRLSVSKTKTFADCKKKFKFSYIDRLPKKEWDFHVYGKFVHKILEDFHLHYLRGGNDPANVVMASCFKAATKEFVVTAEQKKEAHASVTAYLERIAREKAAGTYANVIACEKDFGIVIREKVLLIGFIDRIQIDPDGVLHVCDYKTTKNKKYLKNDWFQLLTYAYVLMLEDPTIEKVRGSYILIRHDFEYITTEFTKDQIMSIKDKFIKYADDMLGEQLFRANPTPLCKYCDFIDVCEEGIKSVHGDKSYGKTDW